MPVGKDDAKQDTLRATFHRLFSNKLYTSGVVAQFFYVGAQISGWSFTIRIVMQELGMMESQASNIYLISMISVFMSLMFPTIYGISLSEIARGEHPEDTKIGASGLIMAILGGALLTPLQGIISDTFSIYTSYIIPAISFVVVTIYGSYAVIHSK